MTIIVVKTDDRNRNQSVGKLFVIHIWNSNQTRVGGRHEHVIRVFLNRKLRFLRANNKKLNGRFFEHPFGLNVNWSSRCALYVLRVQRSGLRQESIMLLRYILIGDGTAIGARRLQARTKGLAVKEEKKSGSSDECNTNNPYLQDYIS